MRKNEGKTALSKAMLMPEALKGLVDVIEFGEEKYTPAIQKGWMKYSQVETMDSAMRHLLKVCNGQFQDEESGLPHIYHALFNIAVLCELSSCYSSSDSPSQKSPSDSNGR